MMVVIVIIVIVIIIIIIKRKICSLLFVPIQNTHMYTFVTSFHGPSHSIPNTMYINIYKSFASMRRNVPIYILYTRCGCCGAHTYNVSVCRGLKKKGHTMDNAHAQRHTRQVDSYLYTGSPGGDLDTSRRHSDSNKSHQ